jgi:phenylalanyl-tRNA synthetase beta chain
MKETLAKALPALAGKATGSDLEIGVLGILHPEVLAKFEIDYPCSSIEFDLQPFL